MCIRDRFIGAFNFIEASGGVSVGEGVQITHHVSIVTHSSHRAMRLLGRAYVTWPTGEPRPGWVAAPVHIGPWCFIGPHSLLEPGTRLGRGCIVRAGSVLRGDYPEHAVIAGNPAAITAVRTLASPATWPHTSEPAAAPPISAIW